MSRPIKEYTPPRDAQRDRIRGAQTEWRTGGAWIYVGEGDAPDFQNSWTNMGGDWQPLRFRWLVDGSVEIEGVITGGVVGTVIFELPGPLYRRSQNASGKDLPVPGVNITDGSHAAFVIAANGEVSLLA